MDPRLLPAQTSGYALKRRCAVSLPRRSTGGLLAVSILLALVLAGCGRSRRTRGSPAATTEQVSPSAAAGKDVKTIYVAGGCFWGLEKYIGLVQWRRRHRGRLRERRQRLGHLRRRQRLRRGREGRLRPERGPVAVPARPVLRRHRSHVRQQAGQRPRHRVPHRHLLHRPRRRAGDRTVAGATAEAVHGPIAVESGPLTNYTRAEDYHQDYLEKNPGGYCHIAQKLFDAASAARPE